MEFSKEEIRVAVWSCDDNKSAGSGGFSLEFFKNNWELLKKDILSFMADFYRYALLTKACTTSFITLIPKISNSPSLLEYRPIFLVGSLQKILSKVLASRLKRVIGCLVSENQSTFFPRRDIADGVLMVNEVMDMARRDNRSYMILKMDFKKAYNSASWSFLRFLFPKMGFREKWIKWI